ncbi:Predicted arabinose efflux permease, MFS family [Neorhodopirellula lusitana]|uniref:Predicted arabinose efflux permease, MFS family n=2 Tax=Neorhodopirellula lusitana TaxID=445327 RepID=A0ABY1QTA1_9BACT|nr:Predicted arabinose efflux permease, MFS family [Neorhodopirellula lusitana]
MLCVCSLETREVSLAGSAKYTQHDVHNWCALCRYRRPTLPSPALQFSELFGSLECPSSRQYRSKSIRTRTADLEPGPLHGPFITMTQQTADGVATTLHNERLILLILAAVQFITIVDFMIVMPLGPQLMRTLEINPAAFGLIVSSYTFAAGVAGLVASATVDRFSRRTAFLFLYTGFLLGTLFCGLSMNYPALVVSRVIAGAFGGIVGGISMAIIGDVFPDSRRGRATGAMMTGFAIASVAGVPMGLFIGTNFGWQMSFIALAAMGLPVLGLAWFALPLLNDHNLDSHAESRPSTLTSLRTTFLHLNHLNAFALMIALTMSGFLVFPYLSVYFVGNVGMTEQQLPLIYIAGGTLTLFASPIVGRYADRYGKLLVFRMIAPISAVMLVLITQLPAGAVLLTICVFGTLMVCNVGRMIPAMAMVTGSVLPKNRGAFLSANSSIQHIGGGVASFLGGLIVVQSTEGRLLNFEIVGVLAAGFSVLSLWLAGRLRMAEAAEVPGMQLSLAAATKATTDTGEILVASMDSDRQQELIERCEA